MIKIFGKKKDLEERKRGFIEEYKKLVQKYRLDFAVKLKVSELGIFPEIYLIERKDISNDVSGSEQTNQGN